MKYIKKPNTKIEYKQYDGRWGRMLYPSGKSTLASSGCGCVSVTHCVMEMDKYMDYTPKNTVSYMREFAVIGHGTEWEGIRKGLAHFGLKDVKQHSTMDSLFKEMAKGKRVAIFLFNGNKAPNGTQWTAGGHYVAAVGYKYNSKRHYFFTKDSGGRNNGLKWKSYERSMKGCVKMIWTARVPNPSIDLPEKGYFEKGDSSPQIIKIQKFLKENKLYKGGTKGNFGTKTEKALKEWQKENGLDPDGKFGAKCLRKYDK